MEKPYNTHLCTFMGRQNNLEILLYYVEQALEIEAVDNYHMIDMTRTMHDHEFIYAEQQRLNEKYPGRVHLVNRDLRGKQLRDGSWKATLGLWSPFYKYCKQFKNNDVIIKCDDDTLFFDVNTLKQAAELRWKNKSPFLMHANTINNGICAYHQAKKGVWKNLDPIIKKYPTSGLTGPLFSHPDLACDCHEQFITDISKSLDNLKKYKLKENIYFTARVSINFIFMLGEDREHLVDIDSQDEYVTSSKIGQELDRPNMIIGDFIAAHHTYGVQEPVMEERKTYEQYVGLRDALTDTKWSNQEICMKFNNTTTIKHDGNYIMKYWCNQNSYMIKNSSNDQYISLDWDVKEREKVVDNRTKIKTGTSYHNTTMASCDTDGGIFNLNIDDVTMIQIQDCTEILRSEDQNKNTNQFLCWPVKTWFRQNYKKQLCKLHKQADDTYLIESNSNPGYYLSAQYVNENKTLYRFKEHGSGVDTWVLEPMKKHHNKAVSATIHRPNIHVTENDPTYATTIGLPSNRIYREYYWMVSDYIWEIQKIGDKHCHIKLVADDKQPLYLSYDNKNKIVRVTPNKQKWSITSKGIQHVPTKKFLEVNNDVITLTDKGSQLRIKYED